MFPDEVDTPKDATARTRFARWVSSKGHLLSALYLCFKELKEEWVMKTNEQKDTHTKSRYSIAVSVQMDTIHSI